MNNKNRIGPKKEWKIWSEMWKREFMPQKGSDVNRMDEAKTTDIFFPGPYH